MMQWKNTMDKQMTSFTNRLEQLFTKVQEMQSENHQLKQEVNDLQRRISLPEEKLSADTQGRTIDNSKPDNVAIIKENMLELLTSCETFQKDLEKMDERQRKFDDMLSYLFEINSEKLRNGSPIIPFHAQ